jgi:hypothetical protein
MAARGEPEGMEIVNPHAGGIDCGAQEHYVAVPPQSVEPGEPFVRCFSAFTEGLVARHVDGCSAHVQDAIHADDQSNSRR